MKMKTEDFNVLPSDPFKDVPFCGWKVVTFPDESQSICYRHASSAIYDVPLWEMRTFHDLAVWIDHLRDKDWFLESESKFWWELMKAK
jgi:hypothetical protein